MKQVGVLTYTGKPQTPKVTTSVRSVNKQPVTFTYSRTYDGPYSEAVPSVTNVSECGGFFCFKVSAPFHESGSDTLKLSWTKVKDAQGYDVFFKNCSSKQNYARVTIKNKLKFTLKGLKKHKAYKAYVRAWRMRNGRKDYIGSASPVLHAITGGYTSRWCNARSVKLNKSSLTLNVGRSKTLKATVKGVKSGRKLLKHVKLVRYYSSDANVATVSSRGKVKAVSKGKCIIWAIANNGVRARVKINVK